MQQTTRVGGPLSRQNAFAATTIWSREVAIDRVFRHGVRFYLRRYHDVGLWIDLVVTLLQEIKKVNGEVHNAPNTDSAAWPHLSSPTTHHYLYQIV